MYTQAYAHGHYVRLYILLTQTLRSGEYMNLCGVKVHCSSSAYVLI